MLPAKEKAPPHYGQDHVIRQQLGDRRDAGLVGYIPQGEDQRRFLAVQAGELALQFDQRMVGAGDVARAARASAHAGGGCCKNAPLLCALFESESIAS
jgi:hypothetical protein